MKNIYIRTATTEDAPEIALLSSELGYPASAEKIHARLSWLLESKNHQIFVAEHEGKVLGWIACERRLLLESGEIFEIVGLVVGQEARRQKVGQSLVMAAEKWASALSADVIRVRSNIKRVESHPFYEAIGFERGKTQHAYFKNLSA